MKKYLLILLFICLRISAQTDTSKRVINFGSDTTWNHALTEADLVLKLEVYTRYYISDGGIFNCNVLAVMKGKFSPKKLSWSMGMFANSTEQWNKRFGAIWPPEWNKPYIVYVGFNRDKQGEIEDKVNGWKYSFFMAAEKYQE